MPTSDDSVATTDGSCPVCLHTPDGDGPWPGVVMYPDAGGVRPTFSAMADEPGSPHLLADRMPAAVYVGAAQDDRSFTTEDGETLDEALTAAGVEHTIEFYPAFHGFAVPDNAPYDEAAARRHWDATTRFFAAHLPR